MGKPFDTTTRNLLEAHPEPWLAYLGVVPDGPIRAIDPGIPTVTPEADKVFRIDGPAPYILHIELQASADATLARRLMRYNVLLDLRLDLRVRSVAVLLRPAADVGHLNGVLDLRFPDGSRIVEFHYQVVRAWQRPVEPILAGELGTLPMAPLADIPREDVPKVIHRIDERLSHEAQVENAGKIMEAALIRGGSPSG